MAKKIKQIDIKKITDQIPEVSELLATVKMCKTELKRCRSKLKSLHKKYQFLGEMLTREGTPLVVAVNKCLRDIGFNAKIIGRNKGADIKIEDHNYVILIEVKGKKTKGNPQTNDTTVIDRYMTLEKNKNNNITVMGVFVLNHEHPQMDLAQRDENPFNDEQINLSKLKQFSMVTATELYSGYLKFKLKEITFETFTVKLLEHGVVQF